MNRNRRRAQAHGLTRDRSVDIFHERLAAADPATLGWSRVWLPFLAAALLRVLVDLTGQGDHAADCGRDHLGRELQKRLSPDRRWRGLLRDRVCRTVVGLALRLLVQLDVIRVVQRWDAPALRYLSDSLMTDLGLVAKARAPKRSRPPSPDELDRRNRESHEAAERAAADLLPDQGTRTDLSDDLTSAADRVGRVRAVRDVLGRGPPRPT